MYLIFDNESEQFCLVLCDPMDCSLPGSSVHGISQVRILEWFAISSSRGSSQPRVWTLTPAALALAGRFFTTELPGKPLKPNWLSSYCVPDAKYLTILYLKLASHWISSSVLRCGFMTPFYRGRYRGWEAKSFSIWPQCNWQNRDLISDPCDPKAKKIPITWDQRPKKLNCTADLQAVIFGEK